MSGLEATTSRIGKGPCTRIRGIRMEVTLCRGADSIYTLLVDDRQSVHFQRRNFYLLQSDVVRYLCHDEFKCSAHKFSTAQRFLRV